MTAFQKIPRKTRLKIVPSMLQVAPIQHSDHANVDLHEWNLDTIESARKNDQVIATKKSYASLSKRREDTKRRQRKKSKRKKKPKENELNCVTDEETEEGSKQSLNCDQDSDVSFQEENDEEIDRVEIEEEVWVEYIKRHKRGRRTHDEDKDTLLDRSSPKDEVENDVENCVSSQERWTRKITEWNPGLDSNIKTSRPVGTPRKRWEDEINDCLRPEESEETKRNDLKNKWKVQAKKPKEWKEKEEQFAKQR